MEKSLTFRSIAISLITFLISNTAYSQPADNYYNIKNKMEAYYNAHPDLKNSEDGEYASFLRWCSIWRNRVDGFDQNSSGSFNISRQGWQQYLANKHLFSSSRVTGVDWKCIGPTSLTNQNLGLVLSLYVDTINDKSRNTIYLGSGTSGIWKTTNGGQDWHNCTDGSGFGIIGVTDIKGDPANGNLLYASIGGLFMGRYYSDGMGILKSNDKGVTWGIIYPNDLDHHMSVNKLLIDPDNSQIIYAIVDNKLIRTLNAGQDWDTIFQTPHDPDFIIDEVRNIRDIEMKPFNRSVLYLATDDQAPWGCHFRAQVWKLSNVMSQDTSQIIKTRLDDLFPFTDSVRTDRFEIAVTPADSNAIFVQCAKTFNDTTKVCVFKYDGTSWKLRFNKPTNTCGLEGIGLFKNTLLVSPKDTNILYIGGNFLARYINFKQSDFTKPTPEAHNTFYHVDTRFALIAKGSSLADSGRSDILFAGNDGGISKSTNGAGQWTSLNGNGLSITQFWGMGGLNSQPDIFAAGSQDNCMFIYNKNSSPEWQNPENIGGDNGDVVFDRFDPSVFYFSMWGDGTSSIMYDTIGQAVSPGFIASSIGEPTLSGGNVPLMINPQNSRSLYWGFHNLYRTSNRGLDTTKISIAVPGHQGAVSAFTFSAEDTCRIYVAYDSLSDYKFLRSHFLNGTYVWTNLTSGLWPYAWYYNIATIEVSPTNSDSVWIGFGGFLRNGDNQRIMLSTDSGRTWQTNYSVGLPNMPVNCIRFSKLGGRVFAGTDVGVFYRDKTMSRWQPFNVGLPQCIVTDLEINENAQKIRAATFGRGIYETSLNCLFKADSMVINHDVTWANDTVLENSVYIDSAATLTIRCKVEFPPSAKIFVKQGAKLIIDNAWLTSHCSNMWQGIEVWGQNKMPQIPLYQGYVMVKNNSIIENARIGITTCQKTYDGGFVGHTTGGIIIAQNCTFRNNYKAIEFVSYPRAQVGGFQNVIFETTAPFIDGISYPSEFVSLYDVQGVTFKGCKFINRMTSIDTVPDERMGNGIYSVNSDFFIYNYSYCPQPVEPCPNPIVMPSSFEGLNYGIKAINYNPAYLVSVNKTHFNNNYRGIYLNSIYGPVITQDTFSIAKGLVNFPSSRDTCYGLYLDHCTLYKVEEDSLRLTGAGTTYSNTKTVGIVVDNSGRDANEIYNNYFNGVTFGIIAQNLNREINDTTGLCIKCNDFSNTAYDIIVNQEFNYPDWGIARNQGWKQSQTDPAGNTFSDSHIGSIIFSDIQNEDAVFNYFHHNQNFYYRVIPEKSNPNKVIKQPTGIEYNKPTSCPSKILNGGGSIDNLKQQLSVEQQSIDSISSNLSLLTDGGNTLELNSTVATSMPSEAMQVRQSLLNSSPYLSDTVMKSAILKEDVLPNEMIRDILVANPQAPKSEDVMDQLNNRLVPMPDSLLADIQNGLDVIGAKDSLGAELYNHLRAKAVLFNQLLNYYKTDTVNPSASHDSLIVLLQNENSISAKYLLAFELLKTKDTLGVHYTLYNIPTDFVLDTREVKLHQDFVSFFNVMNKLTNQEKSIFEMTPDQLATIWSLMQNGNDPVKSFARNVLIASKQYSFNETVILPDETKSLKQFGRIIKTGKISVSDYMKIYPNPARQFIIVEYNLKDKYKSGKIGSLILTNAEGKMVENKTIYKQQDQTLISTSSLPVGIYICTLSLDGKSLESQRVIIAK